MSNIINEDSGGALADHINKYIKSGKGKTVGQLLADLTERFEKVKDYNMQAKDDKLSSYVDDVVSKLTDAAKQFLGGDSGAKSTIHMHIKNLIETGKATLNNKQVKIVNGNIIIIGEESRVNYFDY